MTLQWALCRLLPTHALNARKHGATLLRLWQQRHAQVIARSDVETAFGRDQIQTIVRAWQ